MALGHKKKGEDENVKKGVDLSKIAPAKLLEYTADGETIKIEFKLTDEEKDSLLSICKDKKQVGFLVDQYYQSQQYRIVAQNQTRALLQGYDESAHKTSEQPEFLMKNLKVAIGQEALNKSYMDYITMQIPICRWMRSIKGIGPVLAAYIYATFDIGDHRYATDFMSYAGLNDNNNPWLGNEKGTQLAKEAMKHRDKLMEPTEQILKDIVSDYLPANKDFDDIWDKFQKKIKPISRESDLDTELCDRLQAVLGKKTVIDRDYITEQIRDYYTDIRDYIDILKYPKICTDSMIGYAAKKTLRKPTNIKRGTYNNWRAKKSKTKVPTVDDLASYLAKPPYNPEAKKQMFIIGDMFMKNSTRGSLYGDIYRRRRAQEEAANELGEYKEQAMKELTTKNWKDKDSDVYKNLCEGKLSKGHIVARARRYAVKLFMAHVYEAMYWDKYHEDAPQPYIIAIGGHHDYIAPETDYKEYL